MKCPKCGFTSFDHLDTCKKCDHDLSKHEARFSLRGLLAGAPTPHTLSAAPPERSTPEKDIEPRRPGLRSLFATRRRNGGPKTDLPEMAAEETPGPPPSDSQNLPEIDALIEHNPAQKETEPTGGLRRLFTPRRSNSAPGAEAEEDSETPLAPSEPMSAENDPVPAPESEPEPTSEPSLVEQSFADQEIEAIQPEPKEDAEPFELADFSGLFTDSEPESAPPFEDTPPAEGELPELGIEVSLPETTWSDSKLPPLPSGSVEANPTDPLPVPAANLPCLEERLTPERDGATETEEAEVPPVTPRLVAGLTDLAVLGAIFALFVAVGQVVLDPQPGALFASLLTLSTPYFLVLFALCFGYFTLFHFLSGQTPGKMLARLRVEGEGGTPLFLSQAFLRSVGGLLCCLPLGLGYLRIVFDRERRGWNDRLAGTRVTHLPAGPTRNV